MYYVTPATLKSDLGCLGGSGGDSERPSALDGVSCHVWGCEAGGCRTLIKLNHISVALKKLLKENVSVLMGEGALYPAGGGLIVYCASQAASSPIGRFIGYFTASSKPTCMR